MASVFIDGIIFGIQRGGGISVYFAEFAKYLDRTSQRFTLRAPVNENAFFAQIANESYVKTYRSRLPMSFERLRSVRLDEDSPIFHSTYYRRPASNFDGKQVVTVHDFVAERLYGRSLRSKVFVKQKWKAMQRADHIIAISRFTRDELLSLYPDLSNKRISVIPNGIAKEFKACGPKEYVGSTEIVFVGSRAPYKNFRSVVLALESMAETSLVIVGGGKLRKEETSLLNKSARGRWRHIPYLSNSELAMLLSESAVLVYPSDMEGFGIPPLEAMAVGCPVIVKDIPVTREVCGEAARFLPNNSIRELRAALCDVLQPSVRENLVRAGLERTSMYDWNKTFSSICEIYDGLDG